MRITRDLYLHGFLYSSGSYTTIDYTGAAVPGNQWYTEVTSINDAGVMAGLCATRPAQRICRCEGAFSFVGFPGSTSTYIYGINNAGQLVGFYGLRLGISPWIYREPRYPETRRNLRPFSHPGRQGNRFVTPGVRKPESPLR